MADKITDKVSVTREKITLKRKPGSRKNVMTNWYESENCWLVVIQHRNPETQEFDRTAFRLFKKDGSPGYKYRKAEMTPTRETRLSLEKVFIEVNCNMSLDDFTECEPQGSVKAFTTFLLEDEDDLELCSDGSSFWIEATLVCPGLIDSPCEGVITVVSGRAKRRSLARARFWNTMKSSYAGVTVETNDNDDDDVIHTSS